MTMPRCAPSTTTTLVCACGCGKEITVSYRTLKETIKKMERPRMVRKKRRTP